MKSMKRVFSTNSFTQGLKKVQFDSSRNPVVVNSISQGSAFEIPNETNTYFGRSESGSFVLRYVRSSPLIAVTGNPTNGLAVIDSSSGTIQGTALTAVSFTEFSGGKAGSESFQLVEVDFLTDIVKLDSSGAETGRISLPIYIAGGIAIEGNFFYGYTNTEVVKVDVTDGSIEWSNPTANPTYVSVVGDYVYCTTSVNPRVLKRINKTTGATDTPGGLPTITNSTRISENNHGQDMIFIASENSFQNYNYYLLDSAGTSLASKTSVSTNTIYRAFIDSTGVYVLGNRILRKLDFNLDPVWTYTDNRSASINFYSYVNTDDVVYIGGYYPRVHAVSKTDGSQLWYTTLEDAPYSWGSNFVSLIPF